MSRGRARLAGAFALALGATLARGGSSAAQTLALGDDRLAAHRYLDTPAPAGALVPAVFELRAGPREARFTAVVAARGPARSEPRLRLALRAAAGARALVVAPVPTANGDHAGLTLRVDERLDVAARAPFITARGDAVSTVVALVGVHPQVGPVMTSLRHAELRAELVRPEAPGGEPLWPREAITWGATHAFVVDTGAFVRAPEEARRALEDRVLGGGVLVLSPRAPGDLREGTLARMVGAVEPAASDDPRRAPLRGPRLARLPFGAVTEYGLGAVVLLDRALTGDEPLREPGAQADVEHLAAYLTARGGALWQPGTEQGARLLRDGGGALRSALAPRVPLRPALAFAQVVLLAYVVATAVLVRRARARGTPLQAFTQVPLAGVVTLALLVAAGYVARGTRHRAQVLVLYELGSGAPRAVRHVLASLSAGRAVTFDLTPEHGESVSVATSRSASAGVHRWADGRLRVEGVRAGLWESVAVSVDGFETLGEGVTFSVTRDGRSARVRNGTGLALERFAVVTPRGRAVFASAGALAPGAEVTLENPREAAAGDERSALLFGASAPDEVRALLDAVLPSYAAASPERAELWALARRPPGLLARLGPFETERSALVLRVVAPVPVEPGARAPALPLRYELESYGGARLPVGSDFTLWSPDDPEAFRRVNAPSPAAATPGEETDADASASADATATPARAPDGATSP